MEANDGIHHAHTQSAAFDIAIRTAQKEGVTNAGDLRGGHADAVVGDADADFVFARWVLPQSDVYRGIGPGEFPCICQQMAQCLLKVYTTDVGP